MPSACTAPRATFCPRCAAGIHTVCVATTDTGSAADAIGYDSANPVGAESLTFAAWQRAPYNAFSGRSVGQTFCRSPSSRHELAQVNSAHQEREARHKDKGTYRKRGGAHGFARSHPLANFCLFTAIVAFSFCHEPAYLPVVAQSYGKQPGGWPLPTPGGHRPAVGRYQRPAVGEARAGRRIPP